MWNEKGRKPTYTQTMSTPTSLDSLKESLSHLLSIPTHSFRIQYGGKTITNQVALEVQGVTKGTTVWMMIGGLFGGADMDMDDSPRLASSEATPIHRPTQPHSQETQASIDEWIDRLRISNPLTQDLCITGTQKVGARCHHEVCKHMSRGYTRQHTAARSCSAPLHRCPSLRLLTCVGNEILSGIGACYRRSVSAVSHISQNQIASGLM